MTGDAGGDALGPVRLLLLVTGWPLPVFVCLAGWGYFWRWFIDTGPATCNIHSGEMFLVLLLPAALCLWLVITIVAMLLGRRRNIFTHRDRQLVALNAICLTVAIGLWFLPC